MDKPNNVEVPVPLYQTLAMELAKENLAHARHVENERMTFVSLFLVSMGMILDFLTKIIETDPRSALIVSIILLCFDVICTLLLVRWDNVFKCHMKLAQLYISNLTIGDLNYTAFGKDAKKVETRFAPPNKEYVFSYSDIRKTATGKEKLRGYISTAKLFYAFNILTYLIVGIFIYMSVKALH